MKGKKQKKVKDLRGRRIETPDKRKDLRIHLLVLRVKGEMEKNVFFGYANNISRSGMFISSVNPKNAGEEFTIEFTLPRKKTPIRCGCVVEWCRNYKPESPYEPGMGIRFLDLDEETSNIIDEWVKDSSPFI